MVIYGDMLSYFPELFETLTIWTQERDTVGRWSARENEQQISGIIQNTGGKNFKIDEGRFRLAKGLELWTGRGGLGAWFTEYRGQVFRMVGGNEWDREGGFFRYDLELLQGVDNDTGDGSSFNAGEGFFA